jgi:hypothetical protein
MTPTSTVPCEYPDAIKHTRHIPHSRILQVSKEFKAGANGDGSNMPASGGGWDNRAGLSNQGEMT